MHASSNIRRKAPFVPWFAALILGASAHAGWLVHELRSEAHHHTQPPPSVVVHVDARPTTTRAPTQLRASQVHHRRSREPTRSRATSPRCRHAQADPQPAEHAALDLDIWVQRTARYAYTIDRRALEQVAFGPVDADIERLGVIATALAGASNSTICGKRGDHPIELRNIHAGTPLWLLGLRTGDRLLAIATRGEPELERVDLTIERRGRPVALSYELI